MKAHRNVLLVLAGLLAGVVLAPVGVYAAGSLVEISSKSGRKADVTKAFQLKASESGPETFRRGAVAISSSAGCVQILTAPADMALVVKTVNVSTYYNPSPSSGDFVSVRTGAATCGDRFLADATVPMTGPSVFPLDPGVVLPPGHSVWAQASGDVTAWVTAFGYVAPRAAVPPAGSAPAQGGDPRIARGNG